MSEARGLGTAELLEGIFRRALLLALGAPALAGCSKGEGIESDPGFVVASCDGVGQPTYLEGLEPARPADGLVLTYQVLGGPVSVLEQGGTPCAGSSDVERCRQDLVQPSDAGFVLGEQRQVTLTAQLRATRGEELEIVSSYDELREFLAPVNTPAEAVLLASGGYAVRCGGRSGSRPVADGFEVQLFRNPGCDGRTRYLFHVDEQGNVSELSSEVEHEPDPGCAVGRRPAGLRLHSRRERAELAAHFASSAELEAASVVAFETLIEELGAHGAPASLRARAVAAARDEVRHARAVARLARSCGGLARKPCVTRASAPRSLEGVALENAVEGCVRETYGALVAAHQAQRASSRRVRELYARIARDETRHAALSLDVAAWAAPKLSAAARRRVAAASRRAQDALYASVQKPFTEPLIQGAGLPRPAVAMALLQQLQRALSERGLPGWA